MPKAKRKKDTQEKGTQDCNEADSPKRKSVVENEAITNSLCVSEEPAPKKSKSDFKAKPSTSKCVMPDNSDVCSSTNIMCTNRMDYEWIEKLSPVQKGNNIEYSLIDGRFIVHCSEM